MNDEIATQELISSSAKKTNKATLLCVANDKKSYVMNKKSLERVDIEPKISSDASTENSENATQGPQNQKKKRRFKAWIKNHIPTKRRIIQFYSALLFNANLKGFKTGVIFKGPTKNMCTPGLNCYSCPGATTACPLGSLQNAMTSADKSTAYYIFGIILLYAILAGRFICGWLCPFGLIQELLHKIKTPKLKKSKFTRALSYLKYVILIFFVFVIPIMYSLRNVPVPAFCKYICPSGTLEGAIGLLANKVNESSLRMLGPLFTWKFALMVSIIVASIFIFRFFCRFLCPLGALYGLFNKISIFGIKYDKDKCTQCGLCISKCQMDIKHVGDHECISCGDCVDVCPTKAIRFKGTKVILADNEIPNAEPQNQENDVAVNESNKKVAKKRNVEKQKKIVKIVVSALLLAVLCFSLVYFNFIYEAPEVPQGNSVGDTCLGYDLEIIDENGLSGQTFNPAQYTGKVTVINFWGTWCGPCVAELPHFDELASDYKNTVNVVAIHSVLLNNTAQEYIANNYADSNIIFALDGKNENAVGIKDEYYTALGGTGSWPMTIVLDKNGVISDYIVGSLTHDELIASVNNALNK
ncbi:MAG: 4Fe-4S binding protein [Clostridia bacterium]|nr:4Fe-4S binding protein [Clostridia bacterium]